MPPIDVQPVVKGGINADSIQLLELMAFRQDRFKLTSATRHDQGQTITLVLGCNADALLGKRIRGL
ncbi:hypothetical protein D3C79_1095420 [compost metagenome]